MKKPITAFFVMFLLHGGVLAQTTYDSKTLVDTNNNSTSTSTVNTTNTSTSSSTNNSTSTVNSTSERNSKQMQREVNQSLKEQDNDLRAIRKEVDQKIQKAMDNPLAK